MKPFKTKTYINKGYLGHFLECTPVTGDLGGQARMGLHGHELKIWGFFTVPPKNV